MNHRIGTYKLLSLAFHYPDEGLLTALKEIPEFADALKGVTLEELIQHHNQIFSLTVGGGVPPYETEYGHRDIFMKTQRMADISAFYRAFGLEVPADKHERLDFVGAELDLMFWILLKEEMAKKSGKKTEAATCRDAAQKFLNDHLGRWATFFGEQMLQATTHPFYKQVANMLVEFVEKEGKHLNVRPEKITTWVPAPPAEEPACGVGDTAPEGFSV